jgi:CheY-like chemotaxis protein
MEVLIADQEVERQIAAGASSERIAEAARASGMRSLWEAGLVQVQQGLVDLEELLRVVEPPARHEARRHASAPSYSARGDAGGADVDLALAAPVLPSAEGQRPRASLAATRTEPDDDPLSGAFELLDDLDSGPPSARPKILVADESEAVRALLRRRLSDEGYTVVDVPDGISALEEVDNSEPLVLVVDACLPRLDGWGVVHRLRSRLPTAKLPIVMLSGSTDESEEVRAFAAGVSDFVLKPLRPDALAARLKLLVAARQQAIA